MASANQLTYRENGTVATGITKNFLVKNGITTGDIVLSAIDGSITASSANVSGRVTTVSATVSGSLSAGSATISGITNIGSISNLYATGGVSGQFITTDGSGNLSFATATAFMPSYIFPNTTLFIPEYYQALSGLSTLQVDGNLSVDGVYIEA